MEAQTAYSAPPSAAPLTTFSSTASSLLRVGAIAGLVAGMMMAMWQMVVGALADAPTAVAGISSSFWTPVTGISSVVFGQSWFGASFDFGPVVVGLMGHMMNSAILGIAGVFLIRLVLGGKLHVIGATAAGMMYGLLLQIVLVNGVVNGVLQSTQTLYTATPEWSWYVAHALFGATLGMIAALQVGRDPAPKRR